VYFGGGGWVPARVLCVDGAVALITRLGLYLRGDVSGSFLVFGGRENTCDVFVMVGSRMRKARTLVLFLVRKGSSDQQVSSMTMR
jgi:hypothetical protein